jgi:hypothetical protein
VDKNFEREFKEWSADRSDNEIRKLVYRVSLRTLVTFATEVPFFGTKGVDLGRCLLPYFRILAHLAADASQTYLHTPENAELAYDRLSSSISNLDSLVQGAKNERLVRACFSSLNAALPLIRPYPQSEIIPLALNAISGGKGTFEDYLIWVREDLASETFLLGTNSPLGDELWHLNTLRTWTELWNDLKHYLINRNEDWDVWTRWYDAILNGLPTPGGVELDIFRFTLANEDQWKESPSFVNALIKKKEEIIESLMPILPYDQVILAAGTESTEAFGAATIGVESLTSRELSTIASLHFLESVNPKPVLAIQNQKLAISFVEGVQIIDPLAERSHPEIVRYLKRLSERIPRLRNTHGDLASDAGSLCEKIVRPFDEVATFDVEIWNLSNSISEHLQEDIAKRTLRDSNTPTLDPDDRRALEAVVLRVGPWTRFFPNARRMDEEYRAYHNRPEVLAAVQAALTGQNERLLFLEENTKALMLVALRTAQGSTPQATKAQGLVTDSTKSLAANGFLIARRSFLKGAGFAAGALVAGAAKKAGENIVGDFDLVGEFESWAKKHADDIRGMFANDPPDLQNAIDQLLTDV